MANKERLFLIDAYALIFRGYYAFIKNPRINSKGFDTSAIMGFMNSLLDLIKRESPENLAVAFDQGGSQDRIEIFQEYKANRSETPEAISLAVPIIKEILEAMKIPILIKNGYEADDIIGTIAKNAEKNNYKVFMVTPDKDFAQLVSENIFIYRPARMGNGIEIWGIPEVKEKFEVSDPMQVIDFLGMMGDSVDNIPGLPGVGEKTAKKFLAEFGSIENLLNNTDKIKGKLRDKVESNKEKGLLSKKLATILLDVPIDYDLKSFKSQAPDIDKIKAMFKELEFKRIMESFLKIFSTDSEKINKKNTPSELQFNLFDGHDDENIETIESSKLNLSFYQKIDSKLGQKLLLKKLSNQNKFGLVVEQHHEKKEKLILSFSWNKGKSYCYETKEIDPSLKKIFEDPSITLLGYDLKKIIKLLKERQVNVKNKLFDIKIAHYLINPEISHELINVTEKYLGSKKSSIINEVNNDLFNVIMAKSDFVNQLFSLMKIDLQKSKLYDLLVEVEMPLLKVLSNMELTGIKIDSDLLDSLSVKYNSDLQQIEKKIYSLSGEKFNIGSPKQLGEILFQKLKIKGNPKKTKTGQFSTSEEVLSSLINDHDIVSEVLNWRSLQKLLNTYVDALPKQIQSKSNRIHTVFNQAVASTGRLSSANPNLQNIPIRTDKGREIRKAFICENNDYVMIAADYSQIELRVIASLSNDKNMIKAFNNNIDIHSSTASKIFNVRIDEITREQRSNAKTVNFGIIYGVSAFGLSNQTDLTRSESKEIIDSYYEAYPDLKKYISNQINFARENGFVETVLKRKRFLKDINSRNPMIRGAAERNAVNAPVQGSAADIIKLAMINIQDHILNEKLKSKILIQVHDELVFEVYKNEIVYVTNMIKNEMENAFQLKVPLKVDIGKGENWFDAH